ncbi:non-specific lipid transfer protein GPI-anchored 2-like [Ipomoea triloba]|uniref:non-specific lipid transfer protein GPI-anchored 2-like n=1 Tax=Ipomoea triloba TaxID=35885 RepID=UPI00125E9DA4|nr:non-specific lipid transfer protein GPI-anchored 2-like [Ipomoea triloba]
MAKTTIPAAAALLVAALVLVTSNAQAPAEGPRAFPMAPVEGPGALPMAPVEGPGAFPMAPSSDNCLSNLLNMSDCLNYVQAGSNLTKPDKGCCPELAGLVESHPECLCQLLANPEKIIGVPIELNKALKLPSVCKIDTPSLTLCSAIGIPVGAPTPSSEGKTQSPAGLADASSPVGSPEGFPPSPSSPKGDNNNNAAAPTFATFDYCHFLVGMAAMLFATLF